MKMSTGTGFGVAAACLLALFGATVAVADNHEPTPQEKATEARRGYMQVVVWEAGPLFAMAKGDMEYDAEAAKAHAENLHALSQYSPQRLFVAASSTEDLPGKTRALAKIWDEEDKFHEGFNEWRDATGDVVEAADKGQQELAAAVGAMGKTCGNCHEPYRAEDL